ncbi:MAG TPA: hypothetical protein VLB44_26925, partial [Kofleriaceae bacterium]|nr:hypothetical protein [Kofleriaceae bacterium]
LYSLVNLVRHWGQVDFGDIVGSAAIALIAGVAGGFGVWSFFDTRRSLVLESECPCCGSFRRRTFADPGDPISCAVECGSCIAYLRASREPLEVREESPGASQPYLPFVLDPELYVPKARINNHQRFEFEMPTMCAVCGVRDADQRRPIAFAGGGDPGVLGDIAGAVASDLAGKTRGSGGVLGGVGKSSSLEKYAAQLMGIETAVCTKHTREADRLATPPLEYRNDKLLFTSYGYYKAFCTLNHITRPATSPR